MKDIQRGRGQREGEDKDSVEDREREMTERVWRTERPEIVWRTEREGG